MAGIDEYCDAIKKLRALGVIHFKSQDFEATLGYPFGEPPKPVREGGTLTTTLPPSENAADLVLNPPNLANVPEEP